MSDNSVAVIVPVFNRPHVILEALESIAAQTRLPSRLIVVDDGSTDETALRVEQWIATAKLAFDARLIRQPHSGAAAARNYGVAVAGDCHFLAFQDSDDLWPSDFLDRIIRAYEYSPSAVAASTDISMINLVTHRKLTRCNKVMQGQVTATLFAGEPPGMASTVLPRVVFQAVGGFDAALPSSQDYDLYLRISLQGDWMHVPGDPVIHRSYSDQKFGGEPQITYAPGRRAYGVRQRAAVMDRFIHELDGAKILPEKIWRPELGYWWTKAGRKLVAVGKRDEARECFQRAVEISTWQLRARWHLWRLRGSRRIPATATPPTSGLSL